MKSSSVQRLRHILPCVAALFQLLCIGPATAQYKLVWSDEFEGSRIDPSNWKLNVYPGVVRGSREAAYYTDRLDNARIEDGHLLIVARQEAYDDCAYTSARLSTYGLREFQYGRFEARLRLPRGAGLQVGVGLLPVELTYGAWAASGEVDLVSTAGAAPGPASGLFFGGSGPRHEHRANVLSLAEPDATLGEFHVFGLEWQPYEFRWTIDGEQVAVQNRWSSEGASYPAPFDHPFYLTVGLAVMKDAERREQRWPQSLAIDWIRVYQVEGNLPPKLKITAPHPGARLPAGADVLIQAQGSDPDGLLDRVEFYCGGTLLGTDREAPYSWSWPAPDGCHTIVVRAVDRLGFVCTDSVDIEQGRGCPPTPFHSSPSRIPGRIEAEDFDKSLKGDAYFDTDPSNNGGAYRQTGVDIQPCSEGGHNIGWMIDHEWMQYTVHVERTGSYDILCRVGSPKDTASFHIEVDDQDKTGRLAVPNTGDWQRYTNVVARGVQLSAGEHIMRVVVDTDGFNLNYVEITRSDR